MSLLTSQSRKLTYSSKLAYAMRNHRVGSSVQCSQWSIFIRDAGDVKMSAMKKKKKVNYFPGNDHMMAGAWHYIVASTWWLALHSVFNVIFSGEKLIIAVSKCLLSWAGSVRDIMPDLISAQFLHSSNEFGPLWWICRHALTRTHGQIRCVLNWHFFF